MKKLCAVFLLTFVLAPYAVYASSLTETFDAYVRDQGLVPAKQSACAADATGTVFSYNADMHIIPASVSKLYLFDFALSKLPTNFRYTTVFIRSGNTLYVNGTGDPQMAPEHLQSVLDRVKADDATPITTIAVSPNFYFSMTKYAPTVRAAISRVVPGVKVVSVSAPYDGEGKRYEFESISLPAFLKQTSNYSNNFYSDVLFNELGGADAFADYLSRTYGVDGTVARFHTGSGLSGNYTTCALTLRVLEHLDRALAARSLSLTDIMTMPVVDPGVLSKRHIDTTNVEALVAKSGYLNSHHNLAGIINSAQGHVYFATFTDYPSSIDGREVNRMVDAFTNSILAQYGPTLVSFNYLPDYSIFDDYQTWVK